MKKLLTRGFQYKDKEVNEKSHNVGRVTLMGGTLIRGFTVSNGYCKLSILKI